MLGVAVALVAVAALATIQMRHRRRVGRERRAVIRDVEGLFSAAEVTQDGIDYPTLRGRCAGHMVKVELVVDTLALRQVPTLWMLVTVLRPLPVRTPVDITMRPRSSDIVSPGTRFAYEHPVPAGWPPDVRVCTRDPALPPLEALAEVVALLEQPTTKGVLIASGGVRLVHELARGAVGQYRVVRRSRFRFLVEPARLMALVTAADAIADRVEAVGSRVGARA